MLSGYIVTVFNSITLKGLQSFKVICFSHSKPNKKPPMWRLVKEKGHKNKEKDDQHNNAANASHENVRIAGLGSSFHHPSVSHKPSEFREKNVKYSNEDKKKRKNHYFHHLLTLITANNQYMFQPA